jgi:cell wall-associated NlpC family hydrolase
MSRPTASDFVIEAMTAIGIPYRFGGEASASDERPRSLDCSELVEWAAARVGLVDVPDGSWRQYGFCQRAGKAWPFDLFGEAVRTRGALLFTFAGGDPLANERPKNAHVAIVLGGGRTVEASASRGAVLVRDAHGRGWTHAAVLPGLEYGA